MDTQETDVVIVGGGIPGFAAAVESFRRGLRARILRRDSDGERAPRLGALLNPRALECLARLEIYDALAAEGAPIERVALHAGGAAEPAVVLPYGEAGAAFPHALGISHAAFQAVCLDTFARFTAIQVEQGVELLSLLREKGRVQGALARGPQGDIAYRAKAVVVTTGEGGAPVRAEAGADQRVTPYAEEQTTLLVGRPETFPGEARVWLDARGVVLCHPISPALLRMVVLAPPAATAAARAGGADGWRRFLVPIAPPLEEALKGLGPAAADCVEPCLRSHARSWVGDNVALAGPAALAMSPVTLLAESVAVQDLHALALVLSKSRASGDFSRHALKPYEDRRRPAAEAVASLTHDFHRAGAAASGLWARAQSAGLERLARLPEARRQLARLLAGDEIEVTLADRLRLGGLLPAKRG